MITFKHRGDFHKTEKLLNQMRNAKRLEILNKYGALGVNALSLATPIDSGATAGSWSYEIIQNRGSVSIYWSNSNVNDGVNIAILLQYGHGTGTGGYVSGIDYINPAMKPVFDKLAKDVWKEVTSL